MNHFAIFTGVLMYSVSYGHFYPPLEKGDKGGF